MSYITIYFDNKPVFLCDEITPEINEYRRHPDAVFIDELSTAAINSLLHEIKKSQFHAGIIFDKDFQKLKRDFFKHFELIKAGGGLVKNNSGNMLLMFRRGKWDLPKGKLDEGESIEECALREVEEETGLHHLSLIKPLTITYHTYNLFGKHNLKETHWFLMHADGNENLIPQTEEDISEILWVEKQDLKKYLANTFPTIEIVLNCAG
ncbi:NUDIX domain-containing protein [Hanamia caeni]|jgi:8-oxo-dGTP pyrophosphatase MutT (NUDIX family)|uniref:NUDIX domain-containing protein n=1 Tax=Hanamia caeni TaxID=2294116 RepID=A0A3M9NAD7_9BACT|nr:NUDIX domain-containing protein [Hanamia caeni]RNI34213.1 NUDIX domain-containing protein [Hanamia caeni]